MEEELDFLSGFPRDEEGLIRVWDRFSFDNLFRLLLAAEMEHEDALMFMLAHCSFSALVFQERIHNQAYRDLRAEDELAPDLAALWIKTLRDLVQEVGEEGLI
jgi:hypothetical protein